MTVLITWSHKGVGAMTDINGKPIPNLPPLEIKGTFELHPAFQMVGYTGQIVLEVEPATARIDT